MSYEWLLPRRIAVWRIDLQAQHHVALAQLPAGTPAGIDVAGTPVRRLIKHKNPFRLAEVDQPGIEQFFGRSTSADPDHPGWIGFDGRNASSAGCTARPSCSRFPANLRSRGNAHANDKIINSTTTLVPSRTRCRSAIRSM